MNVLPLHDCSASKFYLLPNVKQGGVILAEVLEVLLDVYEYYLVTWGLIFGDTELRM